MERDKPLRKIALSSLVIVAFAAYAIREHIVNPQAFANPDSGTAAVTPTTTPNDGNNTTTQSTTAYRDGEYVGDVADAYFGQVQIKAVINGGKITDTQFLDYPHDRRTSQFINSQAMPYLQQEAIQAQNAQVDIISGATLTSEAFIQSLQSALAKAQH
jgi:uncharacterized protein with FMN-binding domain